jgi:predicted RNA-binding protein with RPS1 domain
MENTATEILETTETTPEAIEDTSENATPEPAEETATEKESKAPTLNRKDKVTGKVTKVTLAGAVVDFGFEKPGVIHITQIRPKANRIEDVLTEGQEVTAYIRRKPSAKKSFIDLTMVEPLALEWREMKKGMHLSGKVIRIESFGVFVEVGAERPGMVHISELSHDYVKTPNDVVSVDEEVEVEVLDFDRKKKRIRLSRKALLEKPNPLKDMMEATPEEIEEEEEDNTPAPTAMEIALRQAMRKQKGEEKAAKAKRKKTASKDMDEFITRTLENKVRTE